MMKRTLTALFLGCAALGGTANAADIDCSNCSPNSKLGIGIYQQDYEMMQDGLLSGADPNIMDDESGERGIYLSSAIRKHDPELVAFLIQSGALPYSDSVLVAMTQARLNPENEAAQEIAHYLIEEAGELLEQEQISQVLLQMSYYCALDFIDEMIEIGADPNFAPYGPTLTPLSSTIRYASLKKGEELDTCLETAARLIHHGANATAAFEQANLRDNQRVLLEEAVRRAARPNTPKP